MDSVQMFMLFKIVESDGLTKAELHANLVAPDGWMKLAQLSCDDLVLVIGDEVVPTDAGARIVRELRQAGVSSPAVETLSSHPFRASAIVPDTCGTCGRHPDWPGHRAALVAADPAASGGTTEAP